jgi:hypothetical protein
MKNRKKEMCFPRTKFNVPSFNPSPNFESHFWSKQCKVSIFTSFMLCHFTSLHLRTNQQVVQDRRLHETVLEYYRNNRPDNGPDEFKYYLP